MVSKTFVSLAFFVLLFEVRKKIARMRKSSTSALLVHQKNVYSPVEIEISNKKIRLDVTLPPDAIEPIFSGAAWAGTIVWPAAISLSQYLQRFQEICKEKVVLELGSGLGLPGIVAGTLGAKKVYLTEQPPLDDLLRQNLRNLLELDNSYVYNVQVLDWESPIAEIYDKIDVILISDCIYEGLYGESWKALAKVINKYLTENTIVLNSLERRKEDGIDKFFKFCLQNYGIHNTQVLTEALDDGHVIQLYQMFR